ncbi:unnamed protein product, partial [Didymodactylos carnosus]
HKSTRGSSNRRSSKRSKSTKKHRRKVLPKPSINELLGEESNQTDEQKKPKRVVKTGKRIDENK